MLDILAIDRYTVTVNDDSTREFAFELSHAKHGVVHLQGREALEKRHERDLAFGASQRCADAEMRSEPETHMLVGTAVHPELARALKMRGVAVSSIQHLEQHVSPAENHVTHLHILRDPPWLTSNRALVADDLFDSRAYEGPIVYQPLPLLAISQQQGEAVAYQGRRGLVPGHQQSLAGVDYLRLG